ncbi:hypothetical protein K501DRAFT_284663 [Backusella circina FSU 941]|nr:hypothetical protein K501DRAFT_284663 [Backusella circina FSU 941]
MGPTIKKNKKVLADPVQQLLVLFPKGDPDYFRHCIDQYTENAVEHITEKFLEMGSYPQLPPADAHGPLNSCLRILALDLFPNVDIGYLRDLVLKYDCAHIENVVSVLVKQRKRPERLEYGKMMEYEGIRSESYKRQAKTQLIRDFPQIWKSSIRAVLAENNWDYLKSYDQLSEMGSGGFWTTLRNFFTHWSSHTSVTPMIKVNDPDIIKQLRELQQRSLDIQIEKDLDFAQALNRSEYDLHKQLITCDCCCDDFPFEQLLFCSQGDHTFCHECIRHFINEGLFGQGGLRGQARIQCISSMDQCDGCLPMESLQRVISTDVWKAYEKSLLDDCFKESGQKIQCCACSYFELDESTRPLNSIFVGRVIQRVAQWLMWDVEGDLKLAYLRVTKARRGTLFQCRNDKQCGVLTCLLCQRPVRGMHTCYEEETDGLRLYVEKAMVDAVKRTCPICNLSFQKSDGCNKIVCRCGYTMCYVCRKDIGKESYRHFCEHFRDRPGTKCTQCKKCDLYKTDPEDEAVQLAATRARKQYLQAHPEVAKQLPNNQIPIGPQKSLDKFVEWKQEFIVSCLERGLDWLV